MILNNNQLSDNVKNERFEDILIYFSKSLMGKENEEDILWDVAKNCISKLGFVDCVVYLVDHDENLLVQKAAYGPKSPKDRTLYNPVEITIGEGITGSVAKNRKPELILDTSKDSRYIVDDDNRLSEICVPIAYEDNLYGVIDCEHPEKGFFTQGHLRILSAIASICAIKIKNVRDNKRLVEKQENLLKIKGEMIELKLKALNSQLNPHFVFNSLNAVQYFITTQNTKSALDYFSTFSRLVRFYLNQLGKDTTSLYNEIDLLHWYLKLQKLRYDDSFDYTISIKKENNKTKEAVIPTFVIPTLFENIVEQSNINNVTNQLFNIVIKVSEDVVKIEVQYQCKGLEHEDLANQRYREDIVKWKDQVELLNTVKGYEISHETSNSFKRGLHKKNIVLQLPNLV
ncbi:MAG: diguanylate cyclase [Muricauda sp.]|nr:MULTISPECIES: histidine kinase [unclassified Allomuricauda]MAU14772.1 diguanylate cyclase [Allomuricauda sp.]|tara:strand:- start:12075 stop:13274 length:1200 start_codon:yes stop_codon:yes gene_type:complete